ncbi:hypothetical protein GJ744_009529 [Endocarpon pusillum]|uniref:Uncharacterized protein n=1 Tax=Endocarpon pusillum TaxID=364733 RepID=A0A8H7AI03_9EURO|nr:hypothetical protein GJ744_009529 [Endocarpon pusillum]
MEAGKFDEPRVRLSSILEALEARVEREVKTTLFHRSPILGMEAVIAINFDERTVFPLVFL